MIVYTVFIKYIDFLFSVYAFVYSQNLSSTTNFYYPIIGVLSKNKYCLLNFNRTLQSMIYRYFRRFQVLGEITQLSCYGFFTKRVIRKMNIPAREFNTDREITMSRFIIKALPWKSAPENIFQFFCGLQKQSPQTYSLFE